MIRDHRNIRLLDAAMGTELGRRGHELRAPLFSASAVLDSPALVEAIHAEHLRAGASVLRTNTFMAREDRCEAYGCTLPALVAAATALARGPASTAAQPVEIWAVIGPDAPDAPHPLRARIDAMQAAGADQLCFETLTSADMAGRAMRAASEATIPYWLSFHVVARTDGNDASEDDANEDDANEQTRELRLLDGSDFRSLLSELLTRTLLDDSLRLPAGVAVNCIELGLLEPAVEILVEATAAWPELERAAWPNLSATRDGVFEAVAHADTVFAERLVDVARRHELERIGACCGSTPDTLAAIAHAWAADNPRANAFGASSN